MKSNLDDATHWQQKHDEYWMLLEGMYYLFNEGIGRELSLILMGWWSYDKPRNQR